MQEYKVEASLGPLQIAYRESIAKSANVTHSLDQTIGDTRHRVTVTMSVHPEDSGKVPKHITLKPSEASEMQSRIRRHHLKAIDAGLASSLSRGTCLFLICVCTQMEKNAHNVYSVFICIVMCVCV